MISWFLSLFAEHRHLRESLQAMTTEKLILQDRLDSVLSDRNKLWAITERCISEERTAYHMQINAEWQRRGFGTPYPDDPKLPANALPADGGGHVGKKPEMPSARVARATEQFIRNYRQ